jgi:hypothetical protein
MGQRLGLIAATHTLVELLEFGHSLHPFGAKIMEMLRTHSFQTSRKARVDGVVLYDILLSHELLLFLFSFRFFPFATPPRSGASFVARTSSRHASQKNALQKSDDKLEFVLFKLNE